MKPIQTCISCFVLTAVCSVWSGEPQTIDQIIKARKAVLTQIVELAQKQFEAGGITDEHLQEVRVDLYAFCRDSAGTPAAERLQWQKKIIAIEEERKTLVEKRSAAGEAAQEDKLRVEERILAAKQKLLELQAAK
jgi:hypothetical protein